MKAAYGRESMGSGGAVIAAVMFIAAVCGGCVRGGVKEVVAGFTGTSTQILKDTRPSAAAKNYTCEYEDCLEKVRQVLCDMKTYVYATEEGLVAVYVSEADTTPVGVFLTAVEPGVTRVEVSSPSSPARYQIAKKLFSGMDMKLKAKKIEVQLDSIEGKK